MRTKIVLFTVLILIVGALCVGVAVQYQKYQKEQAQSAQARVAQQEKANVAHQVEINGWAGRYEALKAECQKGLAAYGLLTPTIKSKTVAPNCTPVIGE